MDTLVEDGAKILEGIKNLKSLIADGRLQEDLLNVSSLLDIIITIIQPHYPAYTEELVWCQNLIKKALAELPAHQPTTPL